MASETNNSMAGIVERILRERLDQFKVPVEVREQIASEILGILERPERKPYGAAVMTAEASMAADRARERKQARPDDAKPQIM